MRTTAGKHTRFGDRAGEKARRLMGLTVRRAMRRLAIAAGVVGVVVAGVAQLRPAEAATGDLSVMSWNVQGKNLDGDEVDGATDSVASKIRQAGAEYVGLQEISKGQAEDISSALGWGTGRDHVLTRFEHNGRDGVLGVFKEGIAMISKYPMTDMTNTLLAPKGRGRHLQHAKIVKDGRSYHVFNTHLISDDDGAQSADHRNQQAQFVRNQIEDLEKKVNDPAAVFVLGGDFNSRAVSSEPAGLAYKTLSGFMTDAWLLRHPTANTPDTSNGECHNVECGNTVTIRTGKPEKAQPPTIRIDFLFVDKGHESFVGSAVTPTPDSAVDYIRYSDHFPIRAIFGPSAVSPKAPAASFTASRLSGAGNPVTLDGSRSSDPDGRIARWQWTVDGAALPLTGPKGNVALGAGTSKIVRLTVTDDSGLSASASQTLSLPNRAPTIGAYTPNGSVVPGTQPTLTASGSDPDTDSLAYFFHVNGPSVDVTSGMSGPSWIVPAHRLDPGTTYSWDVTVKDPAGASARRTGTFTVAMLPTSADVTATSSGKGYWVVDTYGNVYTYGDARYHGTLHDVGVTVKDIVGLVRTPDSGGYWIVGRDGGVYAFGNAVFRGSMGGKQLNAPVVGMAATKDGGGYWLVAEDGGVFAFGNAGFHGSMGGKPLNRPIVALSPTPSGNGYWLAAEDGGIFAFGDAPFYGSMGGRPLNAPVVDMDATPDGQGYWMTAEDGGVFAFGNAKFFGSMAGKPLNGHIEGMSVRPTAQGYWLNGCDGGVFAFGDAPFYGSNPTFMCRGQ